MKGFLQRTLKEIMKNKIKLGTSDAWSMSRLAHGPSDPAYHIENPQMSSPYSPSHIIDLFLAIT